MVARDILWSFIFNTSDYENVNTDIKVTVKTDINSNLKVDNNSVKIFKELSILGAGLVRIYGISKV